jgi:hypothetical protein
MYNEGTVTAYCAVGWRIETDTLYGTHFGLSFDSAAGTYSLSGMFGGKKAQFNLHVVKTIGKHRSIVLDSLSNLGGQVEPKRIKHFYRLTDSIKEAGKLILETDSDICNGVMTNSKGQIWGIYRYRFERFIPGIQIRVLAPCHLDSIDVAPVIEKKLALWIKYCKKADPQFDVHAFSKTRSMEYSTYVYGPSTPLDSMDRDELNYLWLRSPDAKYAINIYAYRYLVEKRNGKTIIEGGDPEWAIDVIDYKNKNVQRPIMSNHDQTLDDVCWIDNHRFLVTGSTPRAKDDSISVPFFYVFDLENERLLSGTWPSHGRNLPFDYLENWKGPHLGVSWVQ